MLPRITKAGGANFSPANLTSATPNDLTIGHSAPVIMFFAPSGPQSPRRRSRINAIFLTIFIVIAIYLLFFAKPTTLKSAVEVDTGTYADRHGAATTSKPAGELARPVMQSQKVMVVASMKNDDTSWLLENFPDWSKSIYVVDDKRAPLTVAYNKGRESMVYLS